MKSQIAAVGVVVLVIGIAIAGFGLSNPVTQTSTTTTTTTEAVVRDTGRTVTANGFWAMGAANLNAGEQVTGTVSVDNFSASDGPMFIYVQNESSFIAWGGCAPCGATDQVNASLPSSGSYSINWTAPKAGSYYFVLDGSYYRAAAPSHFAAAGVANVSSQSTETSPNTTYNYGGFAVAVLGAIALAGGLVAGPAAKKETSS